MSRPKQVKTVKRWRWAAAAVAPVARRSGASAVVVATWAAAAVSGRPRASHTRDALTKPNQYLRVKRFRQVTRYSQPTQ